MLKESHWCRCDRDLRNGKLQTTSKSPARTRFEILSRAPGSAFQLAWMWSRIYQAVYLIFDIRAIHWRTDGASSALAARPNRRLTRATCLHGDLLTAERIITRHLRGVALTSGRSALPISRQHTWQHGDEITSVIFRSVVGLPWLDVGKFQEKREKKENQYRETIVCLALIPFTTSDTHTAYLSTEHSVCAGWNRKLAGQDWKRRFVCLRPFFRPISRESDESRVTFFRWCGESTGMLGSIYIYIYRFCVYTECYKLVDY